MSVSVIRKWDDVGAPTLWANGYGNIADLLKTVLVDGYGAFPGLGWTLEDTSADGDSVMLRNNPATGTGIFCEINHSDDSGTNQTYRATIAAYESYTAIGKGLGRCPTYGQYSFVRSGYNDSTACPDGIHWVVIGDDRAFWFLTRPYLSNNANIAGDGRIWYVYFFGDYIPIDLSNKSNVALMARNSTDEYNFFGTRNSITSLNSNYWILRDSTLEAGAQTFGMSTGEIYMSYLGGGDIEPVLEGCGSHYTYPIIHSAQQKALGFLPGLLCPLRASGNKGAADASITDEVITLSDRSFYIFLYRYGNVQNYNYLNRVCLSVGEGFRDVF